LVLSITRIEADSTLPVLSAVLLVRMRVNSAWVVLGGAAIGLVAGVGCYR